ncbi:MAG: methyltransferase domain-containing protein [Patescibacteria group bacterium]
MSPRVAEKRRKEILMAYAAWKPIVAFVSRLSKHLRYGQSSLLDVGTGEGVFGLEVAKEFGVSKTTLVDIQGALLVELAANTVFEMADVCDENFVPKFQNQFSVVTCFKALHEFRNPVQAALNLVRILPERGVTFIMDHAEEGWEHLRINRFQNKGSLLHYERDLDRLTLSRSRLTTNTGIRDFWEQEIFPGLPGEHYLTFHGHMYSMIYVARQ